MAIITLPTGMLFGAGSGMGQRRYDQQTGSDSTGAGQARSFGPPRWRLSLISPAKLRPAEAALWEAVLLGLRGRLNHLAAHDVGKPAPLGTRRGTLTLGAAASAGDTSINVTGSGTLLTGDWLGIGSGLGTSQLVKVMADAAGATVVIEPPLRTAFSGGAAVTWDKPVAYYKTTSDPGLWTYNAGGLQSNFALDLLEQWA
jgi:hypothetical protein